MPRKNHLTRPIKTMARWKYFVSELSWNIWERNMNKEERKHPSDYLNDLEEWQEHQYNPGYWTGGNIPPHLKYPKKQLGIFFIIIGVFSSLVFTMVVIKD
jgi:hypothetical protein